MKLYHYIGPAHIAERVSPATLGTAVASQADVLSWAKTTGQQRDDDGQVTATFIVAEDGVLRIADRRSEHVVCAGGRPVRSAGEMTFALAKNSVTVVAASNQSTGYCPEPESWLAVEAALNAAELEAPEAFAFACTFRLCPACGNKNLVKDLLFVCEACGSDLPAAYNCQE